MKQVINDFVLSNWQQLKETFSISLIILVSLMIKVSKGIQEKIQFTFKWLFSEFVMSTVVAITCYLLFDKWLHLDKFLVYIICSWAGALSAEFYTKMKELLGHGFEWIKSFLKPKNLIILFTVGLFLLASCGKKAIESTHTIERITTHKRDSVVNREISKAISDSLFVAIGNIKTSKPECDSITNAKIQELLRQISSMKKSGNNELGFYYDEINKKLVAYGKVGQSIDEKIKILNDLLDKTTDKEIKEIPVEYIPKWVQYLAWLGCAFIVLAAIKIYKKFTLPA